MTVVEVIVAGLVVLGVSMFLRHRRENPPRRPHLRYRRFGLGKEHARLRGLIQGLGQEAP